MSTPIKRGLQQIVFNDSSDIDYKEFINLYKKCTAKPYFFSAIDVTLASDNPLNFRKNFLERIQKQIMAIDNKIMYEKLQYQINRGAGKISLLSSGKTDKHEYLTEEQILPFN